MPLNTLGRSQNFVVMNLSNPAVACVLALPEATARPTTTLATWRLTIGARAPSWFQVEWFGDHWATVPLLVKVSRSQMGKVELAATGAL